MITLDDKDDVKDYNYNQNQNHIAMRKTMMMRVMKIKMVLL